MGWGNCGEDSEGRGIGYCHEGICDHPGCKKEIDRGLSYACGGMHGTETMGGDDAIDFSASFPSCEKYFCEQHQVGLVLEHEDAADISSPFYCLSCAAEHNKNYREDSDFRSLWPTDAKPLELET